MVSFDTPKGDAVAMHVNYAPHLDTVGGTQYSADYPYPLSRLLGEARGPGMLTLFTIGCAGNLNHIDVTWADKQKGHNEAARIGTVLAAEALKTMKRLGAPIEAEVQAIALGDQLAWVGLPGEIFTELGLTIKTASPFRYTVVAEPANGSIGYVPNRKAYPEGACEAERARCGPGAGELPINHR